MRSWRVRRVFRQVLRVWEAPVEAQAQFQRPAAVLQAPPARPRVVLKARELAQGFQPAQPTQAREARLFPRAWIRLGRTQEGIFF
jgi:hypothetical protein